jgi:membrane protein
MTLKSRAVSAASSNLPAVAAGFALLGTFAASRFLGDRAPPPDRTATNTATATRSGGWAFWKRVLVRTYEEINNDRLLALAAGVVFYGLLALFPAITALVSCYALFANPATITDHLATLQTVMPQGGYGIVQDQINRIISNGNGSLSLTFFASLGLALWSANAGLKAIIDALNVVYEVKERRSFITLNLVSLTMTICSIIGMLLAIGAVVVVPVVISYLPLGSFGAGVIAWLRWPAVIVLLMLGLAALYRFGPNRDNPRWQWLGVGNVVAVLAWLGGSLLLSWYLGNFANYDATYGSLGAAIGLMMWLWITAIVVLVGAELNSEIEAAAGRRSSTQKEQIGGR